VTTIVSEQKSIWRSSLLGALWGVGHTASLLIAGVLVIIAGVVIPGRIAAVLEFAVALMIIFLGGRILFLTLRNRRRLHVHSHVHDGHAHTHFHFHDPVDAHEAANVNNHMPAANHHSRVGLSGWRALVVGMIHGLAGSAVLTLLVLAEVVQHGTRFKGMAYLLVFGLGSIGGMMLMSTLISLPIVFTTRRFESIDVPMRLVVSISSIAFGLYYAWMIGHAI
jgi:ABC-type nickel/cobalt efflux system permease component RcnA